jgi:tagatose 6-phosphate kinase
VILVAGLSPAWQQIMRFDSLRVGQVNRATAVHWCASGKVINAGLALARLDAPVEILSTIGGASGEAIRSEVATAGIVAHWITTAAPTRVCTTVLDATSIGVTELVGNTAAATPQELDDFLGLYQSKVCGAKLVLLTGSLPAGAPANFYRDLLRQTNCPVILDFRGPELWSALETRPLLVKPNREELAHTVGRELTSEQDVEKAIEELHSRGAQWVTITDGARPMLVSGPGQRYRLVPPSMEFVNPIASGDCLAAGTAWGLHLGLEMREALQLGVAAAAENVAQLLPALLDPQAVRRRAATVRVETL